MLLRSDSGGATHGFIDALRESGVSFSVGSDVTEAVRQAVAAVPETGWRNAVEADGDRRDGAQVAELHTLDLSGWPARTRAIVRRERPHPRRQPAELLRRRRLAHHLLHH